MILPPRLRSLRSARRLPGRTAAVAVVPPITVAAGTDFAVALRTGARMPVTVVARTAISIAVAIAARATVAAIPPWAPIAPAARTAIAALRRWHLTGNRRAPGEADLPVRRDVGAYAAGVSHGLFRR